MGMDHTDTIMGGGDYMLLDDDAVDAAVQDDLDQEMYDDSGLKKPKRKKDSSDLTRYFQYQQDNARKESQVTNDQAAEYETDSASESDGDLDEGEHADEETEEATGLVAIQTARRSRRRGTVIDESGSE